MDPWEHLHILSTDDKQRFNQHDRKNKCIKAHPRQIHMNMAAVHALAW